ncbi:MAG: hypothetical protein JNG84_13440 [Archangium sp.]|nr:hypothetical protein [Archangium sp.]
MCEANIDAYFFDTSAKQCARFSWGGCADGDGVKPFKTLSECEACACR